MVQFVHWPLISGSGCDIDKRFFATGTWGSSAYPNQKSSHAWPWLLEEIDAWKVEILHLFHRNRYYYINRKYIDKLFFLRLLEVFRRILSKFQGLRSTTSRKKRPLKTDILLFFVKTKQVITHGIWMLSVICCVIWIAEEDENILWKIQACQSITSRKSLSLESGLILDWA